MAQPFFHVLEEFAIDQLHGKNAGCSRATLSQHGTGGRVARQTAKARFVWLRYLSRNALCTRMTHFPFACKAFVSRAGLSLKRRRNALRLGSAAFGCCVNWQMRVCKLITTCGREYSRLPGRCVASGRTQNPRSSNATGIIAAFAPCVVHCVSNARCCRSFEIARVGNSIQKHPPWGSNARPQG